MYSKKFFKQEFVMRPPCSPPLTRTGFITAWVGLAFALSGCGEKGDDTGSQVTLPEETAVPDVSDTAWFEEDTGSGTSDDTPSHSLQISQTGTWELSPRGGPWTTLVGELLITEVLDGDEELPACTASFALTGEALEEAGCDGCEVAFAVSFYLNEGDPGACRDPDTPQHGDLHTFGLAPTEDLIYLDYHGSGIWIPWYAAEIDEDDVAYAWLTTLAVAIEEEEE